MTRPAPYLPQVARAAALTAAAFASPALAQPDAPAAQADTIVLQMPVAPPAASAPVPATPLPLDAAEAQHPPFLLELPAHGIDPDARASADLPEASEGARARVAASEGTGTAAGPAIEPGLRVAAAQSVGPAAPAPDDTAILPTPDSTPPTATASPAATPVEPAQNGTSWLAIVALGLAGLIPLALGLAAFAWFRRRARPVGASLASTGPIASPSQPRDPASRAAGTTPEGPHRA